jgi:Flp pilus assembly pilin Flp
LRSQEELVGLPVPEEAVMDVRNWNFHSDEGASAVEYGLIAVAIAAVVASIVFVLGETIFDKYETACTEVTRGQGDC